jgi:pimeloyl-ACP methyl ester carboxylesterase
MDEQSKYVSIGKEQLHYLQWGSGSRLLLAFHGYGDDATIFSPFREHLRKDYTILSFDLPHHGNSKWTDNTNFSKHDLFGVVESLMTTYNSMGSRVCLAILEFMPCNIDKVALIAADGLSINFYYYFLTRTFIGKRLFKKMMEQPGFFFSVVNWLNKKNLVNASRHKFVMNFMHSESGRKLLLQVWPGMSDIIPSPTKLKRLIRQYNIPVSIFMGANDRITPPYLGRNFQSGLDTVQLHILEKGHRVFDHENAEQIAQCLL